MLKTNVTPRPADFFLIRADGSDGLPCLFHDAVQHVVTALRLGRSQSMRSARTGAVLTFEPGTTARQVGTAIRRAA